MTYSYIWGNDVFIYMIPWRIHLYSVYNIVPSGNALWFCVCPITIPGPIHIYDPMTHSYIWSLQNYSVGQRAMVLCVRRLIHMCGIYNSILSALARSGFVSVPQRMHIYDPMTYSYIDIFIYTQSCMRDITLSYSWMAFIWLDPWCIHISCYACILRLSRCLCDVTHGSLGYCTPVLYARHDSFICMSGVMQSHD